METTWHKMSKELKTLKNTPQKYWKLIIEYKSILLEMNKIDQKIKALVAYKIDTENGILPIMDKGKELILTIVNAQLDQLLEELKDYTESAIQINLQIENLK